jgi:membrane protein insertase Oxa1/YidC/SpoIIIJ
MTDDSIKREEIRALMEVQSKSTEQMVLVAERLKLITDAQEKIANKLSNGIVKDLKDEFDKTLTQCNKDVLKDIGTIAVRTKEIKDSVNWLKILFGITGIVIIIATVLLRLMGH